MREARVNLAPELLGDRRLVDVERLSPATRRDEACLEPSFVGDVTRPRVLRAACERARAGGENQGDREAADERRHRARRTV